MIGCDVSDREQVHGMSEKILAEFGRVDVLINNAGIGMRRPFVETSLDLIEEILRVNYLGAVYCTHELLPSMIARHCGHIVNISSGAGKIGTLNMAAYCGSKFAMNGWSESLYYELQPLGVKVSVLCPGPVATEFGRDFKDTEPKSPASLLAAASAVSRDVIALIESARFERITPRWLAFLSWVRGTAPGIFRRLARRRFTPYVVSAAPNRAPQTGNKSEF
jgi:short-subunit dehydrogenase